MKINTYSSSTKYQTKITEFFLTPSPNAIASGIALGTLHAQLRSVSAGDGETPGTLLRFGVTAEVTKALERMQAGSSCTRTRKRQK